MGGCSAINCSNHSRKGSRMVRFPADKDRRKKWVINTRRSEWEPSSQAQLCIAHFEESQFEEGRADGWRKLKPNAIPTLFDIPNPPLAVMDKRKKGFGCPKPNSLLEKMKNNEENSVSYADLKKKNEALEKENKRLKEIIQERDLKLSSFLSTEQMTALGSPITNWSEDSVIKGLKLRFALGKQGYNYLRSTGYPAPSYSTLNRRIQSINMNFGVLDMLFPPLKAKVESMKGLDKNCVLLVDEMDIANYQDFDQSSKSFIGNITLGKPGVAKHYTVVMLRGLSSPWKQVVAHELTGPSTSGPDMRVLIEKTIEAARAIGLQVRASTSDMGSNNQAMWSELGLSVSRNKRATSYTTGGISDTIYAIADVPHLLKNMKSTFLSRMLILPEAVCKNQDLPSTIISSGYLKQLWLSEINSDSGLRSLHHLKKTHLYPTHFSTMNVALAVQLFSIKTAAAIEKAVYLMQIPKDALTTAWWIRLVAEWFELMTARHPKCGITLKNKDEKFKFLNFFLDIIQKIQLGKGWKPLQTGMIMSTLNVINLTEDLLLEGFKFVLPGRLTQDALENVFSQIRRKSATKPTALQAKQALKLICVSQFISKIKNSNYASDSDHYLLKTISLHNSASAVTCNLTDQHFPFSNNVNKTSTSSKNLAAEENDIYFIAGATLRAVSNKKSVCESCIASLQSAEDVTEPTVPIHRTLLTDYCDRGGLLRPKSGVYRICREAERIFQKNKENLLSLQLPITDELILLIKSNCSSVNLPTCCNVKEIIINHYLLTRCKGLKTHLINKRAHDMSYGSASVNKKQKKS